MGFRITVVGVGGAGCMAACRFPELDDHRVSRVLIDAKDALAERAAESSFASACTVLTLPSPANGTAKSEESMNQSFEAIRERFEKGLYGSDNVLLFGGLAGKTGGRIAPMVACCASMVAVPVIAHAYLPWASEGAQAQTRAQKSLARLLPHCVHVSVINNESLYDVVQSDASRSMLLCATAAIQAWNAIDVLRLIRLLERRHASH